MFNLAVAFLNIFCLLELDIKLNILSINNFIRDSKLANFSHNPFIKERAGFKIEQTIVKLSAFNTKFNLFKGDNGLYYRIGSVGSEKVTPKSLGYTKHQLDKLWVIGLPIIDLSLV